MKINNSNQLSLGGFAKYADPSSLEDYRYAGKVVANTLNLLEQEIINKTNLNLLKLNQLAEDYIYSQNCIPTFKNYTSSHHKIPFPTGVCISVNNILVHGIPKDYNLQEGDIVSFDLGSTYKNQYIADSAITIIVGNPKFPIHKKLVEECKKSLDLAISAIKNETSVSDIGIIIENHAKKSGFKVISDYGGHFISPGKAHDYPFIPNSKSISNSNIRLQNHAIFAIEPLFVLPFSNAKTSTTSDNWSVMTDTVNAHFEHTIYLFEDKVEVLTKRN